MRDSTRNVRILTSNRKVRVRKIVVSKRRIKLIFRLDKMSNWTNMRFLIINLSIFYLQNYNNNILLFANKNRRRYMFSIIRLNSFLSLLRSFFGSFHNIFIIRFLKICRKCQVIAGFRNFFINFFFWKAIRRTHIKIGRRFFEKIWSRILEFFYQFGRGKLFLQSWK